MEKEIIKIMAKSYRNWCLYVIIFQSISILFGFGFFGMWFFGLLLLPIVIIVSIIVFAAIAGGNGDKDNEEYGD